MNTHSSMIAFLSVAAVACLSCASPPEIEEGSADQREDSVIQAASDASTDHGRDPAAPAAAAVRYHEIRDPSSGMVQAVSPIPASWEVHPSGSPVFMSGPGGVTVYRTETTDFSYSDDPFMRQTIQQMGRQLSPPLSLEQILEQHVKPAARAQGNRFVRAYPIPEVEGFWQRFASQMVQTGSQRQFRALGSEWTDDRGKNSFVSLVQSVFRNGQVIQWTLQTTSLEAPAEVFDEARTAWLYAVGNTHVNPQWQQMMNGQLVGQLHQNQAFHEDMMARSQAAHRQRMAAIEQWGNTSRSVGNTYSEILDISHAGYLSRDSINSAGHAGTIDAIGERTVIGNHETGEHYTVDAGSNYYWVGNDGTYFGTDNALYDPRIDDRVNEVDWTKFANER